VDEDYKTSCTKDAAPCSKNCLKCYFGDTVKCFNCGGKSHWMESVAINGDDEGYVDEMVLEMYQCQDCGSWSTYHRD